jgi:hypothetical protein
MSTGEPFVEASDGTLDYFQVYLNGVKKGY